MSNHNDELIQELRVLRLRLAKEVISLQDLKEQYEDQRQEVAAVRKAIEEVLEEIETGSSGRPILDHCNKTTASEEAEPAYDWRAVTILDVLRADCAPAKHGRETVDAIKKALVTDRPAEPIRTVGDIADVLSVGCGTLEDLGLGPKWTPILAAALIQMARDRRWGPSTAWADGIPTDYLKIDPIAESSPDGSETVEDDDDVTAPPPLPDGRQIPGFRAATKLEWRAAPADQRSACYRLVRDSLSPDGSVDPTAAKGEWKESPAPSKRPRKRKETTGAASP